MMLVDADLVRRRAAELGMSQRQLATAMGVTSPVLRGLDVGTNHCDLTIGQLQRLAGALNVELHELIRPAPDDNDIANDASAHDATDAATIGAILHATGVLTNDSALCDITGWPLARVRSALAELERRLPTVGLRLHRLERRYSIQRDTTAADAKTLKTAVRKHLARDGLNLTEARVLRQALDSALPREPTNAEQVAIGVLVNAGLLELAEPGGVTASRSWAVAGDVRAGLRSS